MLGPEEVDTCPCGNYSLLTLVGSNNRETCLDSIPVCEGVCKKKLSCGHSCKSNCHEVKKHFWLISKPEIFKNIVWKN